MKKMWSPWRSNYIESFKNKSDKDECVFCNAVNENVDDKESLVVYKGKTSFIMLNLYPYNNGHLMIIPNRHTSDPLDLSDDEIMEIMKLNKLAMKAVKNVMHPHGFNFGANIGKAAGAGIHEHIHFHLVPRWQGDTNFMPVLGEVKIISQDLLETKRNLKSEIDKLITGLHG